MAERKVSASLLLRLQNWSKGWKDAARQGQGALGRMRAATRKFGAQAEGDTRRAGNAFSCCTGRLKGSITGAIGSIGKMAVAFAGAQMALMALQNTFRSFIGGANTFESTLAKTVGLTSLTREELEGVQKQLLAMAPEIGKSPNELADAFYFAVSALGDTDKALEAVRVSAMGAAAGLGETKEVVDAVTSVMNAYNMSASEAERVTDTLVATVKEGKMEPADLARSLGKVLPLASALSVSFEELGANIAVMTRIGMNCDEVTTSLNAVLQSLIKTTPAQRTAFEDLGLTVAGLRDELGEEGLHSVLMKIVDAAEGDIASVAELIPNIRALRNVLGSAVAQGETYEGMLGRIEEAEGLARAAFEEYTHTFEYQMNVFKTTAQAAFFEFAQKILPTATIALKRFLQFIKSGFNLKILREEFYRAFQVDIKGIIPVLETFKSGLRGVGDAIKWVVSHIGDAIKWVVSHKPALIALGIAFAALFAWMHPLAAAVVGLILVIGWLRDHWGELGRQVEWLKDVVNRNFGFILDYAKAVWTMIYNRIKYYITQIRTVVSIVMALLKGDWGAVWDGLKSLVKNALANVVQSIKDFGNVARSAFGVVWTGIKLVFADAINWIIGKLNALFGGIEKVTNVLNKIPGVSKIIPDDVGRIPEVERPGLDFGGAGWGSGLSAADKAEIARMKARLAEGKGLSAIDLAEIARMKARLEETGMPGGDGLPTEPPPVEKYGEEIGEGLETAAQRITTAVRKFIDPIEAAFRKFAWAWRLSGLMWQDFVKQSLATRVPKLQQGVRNFAGGMALLGERGPELALLPHGASVLSAPDTRRVWGAEGAKREVSFAPNFDITAIGDTWEKIKPQLIRAVSEMLDNAASRSGMRNPLTTSGVGHPRL